MKAKKIKALYIGQRENGKHIRHVFLIEGKETYWSFARGWIGQTYWAEKTKDGYTMIRRPERVSDDEALPATEKQTEEWNVLDEITRQKIAERRSRAAREREIEKKSKSPRIIQLRKDIAPLIKGLDYFGRENFIRALLRGLK